MKNSLYVIFFLKLSLLYSQIGIKHSVSDTLSNFSEHKESSVDSVKSLNPWQQAKGEILLSPFVSHYQASSFRDQDGNKQAFGNNGEFTNYNPRLYFSFALNDTKLNLFGSIPYFINRYEDDLNKLSNKDFGDLELGVRFNLLNWENNYLMGAVIGYAPIYNNNKVPFAGFKLFGIEPRLIFAGTSKKLGEYNNFHKIELGVRYFMPEDPLQFRLLLSEGYNLTNKLLILGEIDMMFSYSDNANFFEDNLQLVADFKMIKASLNLGYRFSSNFEFYGGLFHDVFNRNTAIGSGFQLFGVIRID